MRRAPNVRLHWRERRDLAALVQSPTSPRKLRVRAGIVLRASDGSTNEEIASELGTDAGTVGRWRRRFLLHGLAGILKDAPRPGRPPSIPDAKVEQIVRATVDHRSPGALRLSTRGLARETGVSKSTVQRIWRARGIGPGRRTAGNASPATGMRFLENVTDMVGVFLDPPARAIAFSTDERVRAPTMGRSAVPELMQLRRRSSGAEFRAFLQVIDRETPAGLDVHLLLDSRLAPTPPALQRWLAQHGRFHLHYLPSDQTGLTLIDRLVTDFSRRRPRPGETPSAQRLRHAIREHLRVSRGVPSPFVWTTTAEDLQQPLPGPADKSPN